MKTRSNTFMRVVSLCLALCLIVGLIWLPSKQNHTHAESLTGSTTASVPVGDTIVFNEDFADGITTGWNNINSTSNKLVWTAPNKRAVLTTTQANDALIQNKIQRPWDGFYARSYYWGMDYTFDAKIGGVNMGVTMYAGIMGSNAQNVNDSDNSHMRYTNMMVGSDGTIYKDLAATEANKVGQIDTTKYNLNEWHTYTFRWVKTTAYSGSYYIWLYIDGELVPYNNGVTVGSKNGGSGDYFAIKIEDSVGTLEIDNVKQIAANFSGSGLASDGTVNAGSLTYDTRKGQPDTIFADNFESGAASTEKWPNQGKDAGATITVGDEYDNNTGYVTRLNKLYLNASNNLAGTYHNSYWFDDQGGKMIPANANMYISMDLALEPTGAIQFRMSSLVYNQYYDAKLYRTDFQYAIRQAIGNNKAGLYLFSAADGAAPLVDLSDVDMTQWHTYTLKVLTESGNVSPVVEFYVDGELMGSFTKPGDGGYSGAYISTDGTNAAGVYYANDEYRRRFQITDNSVAYNLGLTGAVSFDNVMLSYDAWTDKTLTPSVGEDGKWSVSWNASPFEEVTSKHQSKTTSAATIDEVLDRAAPTYDVYVDGVKVADGISATTYTHNVAADCLEATSIEVKIHGSLKTSAGLTTTVQPHIKGTPVIENETGDGTYDEVYYCTVCGEEVDRISKNENLETCTPGAPVLENMIPATCTQEGSCDEVVYCTECGKELSRVQKNLEVQPHSLVVDEAVAPSCTETGLTEGYHCQYCGKVYVAQEVIPVVDHTPGDVVIENVVGATCAAVGTYDEAIYCTECGKELSRTHKTTEKLPHTPVTDKAVEPSCTETGLTEGSHCDVCGEVFVAQEIVPVVEHTAGEVVVENAVGATCGATGSYEEVVYCSVCSKELSRTQKTTDKLPHTPVTDAAVAAGCETTGLTEGSHCGVCGEVLVAQEEVPAAGHTEGTPVQENVSGATCGATGSYEEVVYCSVCSKELSREHKTTDKLPHTPVTDAAVAAGCETTGLTEGSHCGVCGEVLVAQEEVPALGHSYDNEYDTTCNNEGCTTGDREGPAQTGDASIIALAAMMLPASGIGLSALCIKRKKEN